MPFRTSSVSGESHEVAKRKSVGGVPTKLPPIAKLPPSAACIDAKAAAFSVMPNVPVAEVLTVALPRSVPEARPANPAVPAPPLSRVLMFPEYSTRLSVTGEGPLAVVKATLNWAEVMGPATDVRSKVKKLLNSDAPPPAEVEPRQIIAGGRPRPAGGKHASLIVGPAN